MLAKEHGIVAGHLVLEDGVSVVGIAEATGAIELPLDTAEVTRTAGVLIRT